MRLPRYRVRTLMIAVAIAGAVGGAWTALGRRRERFERLGWYHRGQVVSILFGAPGADGRYVYEPTDHGQSGELITARQKRLDRWHEAMAQKYWQAARYPWLPVARDPPRPE
ncbi:MAG: hypothetical protein JO303_11665 [Caulobacteraceae bacterium]|nr:hypothetical protein [Caulobacteraceae bacterium]